MRTTLRTITLSAAALASAGLGQAQTFEGLGALPGPAPWSEAYGVSSDGRTVTGTVRQEGHDHALEPFLWTPGTGLVGLGTTTIPSGTPGGRAYGLSGDGRVVVGVMDFPDGPSHKAAAMAWTRQTGYVSLGRPTGSFRSEALAASRDGAVVVGQSRFSAGWGVGAPVWYEATRFAGGQIQGLGAYPGGLESRARGISNDGRVVVGAAGRSDLEGQTAFRWTAEEGLVSLGDLPGGYHFSAANAASTDGSVIVGFGTVSFSLAHLTDQRAMRWTAEGGMRALPTLPQSSYSEALAVSDDGRVAAGWTRRFGTRRATLWHPQQGVLDLQELMAAHGVDLSDWTWMEATDLSADGRTVVGWGMRSGQSGREAWRATLP